MPYISEKPPPVFLYIKHWPWSWQFFLFPKTTTTKRNRYKRIKTHTCKFFSGSNSPSFYLSLTNKDDREQGALLWFEDSHLPALLLFSVFWKTPASNKDLLSHYNLMICYLEVMMVIFKSETVIPDKANPCLVFMTREMEEKRGEECNGLVHGISQQWVSLPFVSGRKVQHVVLQKELNIWSIPFLPGIL